MNLDKQAFASGAEWMKKYFSWISVKEQYYPGKELTRRDIKVICWQPIPSFDEILEANRDVLERIKEKGD